MEPSRIQAEKLFRAALRAVDPYEAVGRECGCIRACYREKSFRQLLVIGFGKAACPMARAVEDWLGDLPVTGVVVTKYGHSLPLLQVREWEAGHPIPDTNGVEGAGQVIRLAQEADERTLALVLISGGGSALLAAPSPGLSLADKQQVTMLLLASGADIFELNTVRKHLSRVKGGRLAEILYPATSVALILSDVLGDPLDVIASGPTVPDPSSYADALAVLKKYRLMDRVPEAVARHLSQGKRGYLPETPVKGSPVFGKVDNRVVGNLAVALEAARREAQAGGMKVEVASAAVTGEARDAGKMLARRALEVKRNYGRDIPVVLLSGGETTVTVTGHGSGGRNQELALAFAGEVDGIPGITLLAAGTDGDDGTTGAAGAFVDGSTVRRGKEKGLDFLRALADNDSYTFFREEGGLFITGPTGTNVNDLQIILVT